MKEEIKSVKSAIIQRIKKAVEDENKPIKVEDLEKIAKIIDLFDEKNVKEEKTVETSESVGV